MKNDSADMLGAFLIIGFIIAGVVGWLLNLYYIITGSFEPLTGFMVARVIGVFLLPLGAMLGYV